MGLFRAVCVGRCGRLIAPDGYAVRSSDVYDDSGRAGPCRELAKTVEGVMASNKRSQDAVTI